MRSLTSVLGVPVAARPICFVSPIANVWYRPKSVARSKSVRTWSVGLHPAATTTSNKILFFIGVLLPDPRHTRSLDLDVHRLALDDLRLVTDAFGLVVGHAA